MMDELTWCFVMEHCPSALDSLQEAECFAMEDLLALSNHDIDSIFGVKIGARNQFCSGLQALCPPPQLMVLAQEEAGTPSVLAVAAPAAFESVPAAATGGRDGTVTVKAEKAENARGWGGHRATKQHLNDPAAVHLLRTHGQDFYMDGQWWAGGYQAEETVAIMKAKGGVGGVTDSEFDACIHFTGQKVGMNFNYVLKHIPFAAPVREFCFLLEKHTGTTTAMLAARKLNVGDSLRNRITIIVAGRSPSKGVCKELMDRWEEFPEAFKREYGPYVRQEKWSTTKENMKTILTKCGFLKEEDTDEVVPGEIPVVAAEIAGNQDDANDFEVGLGAEQELESTAAEALEEKNHVAFSPPPPVPAPNTAKPEQQQKPLADRKRKVVICSDEEESDTSPLKKQMVWQQRRCGWLPSL
jgi:hypothetical protein